MESEMFKIGMNRYDNDISITIFLCDECDNTNACKNPLDNDLVVDGIPVFY